MLHFSLLGPLLRYRGMWGCVKANEEKILGVAHKKGPGAKVDT